MSLRIAASACRACFSGAARRQRPGFPGSDDDQHGGCKRAQHQRFEARADQGQHGEQRKADHVRERHAVVDRVFEQRIADQIERRASDTGDQQFCIAVAGRMREHQFVGDRADDDAGDDRDMQIGVREARQSAGVFRMFDGVGGALRADVEIDPPHGDAADERLREGGDGQRVPVVGGEGRAGDQDAFAQCDDDEQAAALGEMAAFHVPVGQRRTAEAGHEEKENRADAVDRQRDQPQDQPRVRLA